MRKIIIGGAIAALTITGLAACGQESWQEALEDEILNGEDAMSGQELEEFCAGVVLFGIDTPEKMGALVLGFDDTLPTGDVTVGEWADVEGESLDDLPFDIDVDEVTVRELVDEAGAILLEQCE